MTPFSQTYIVGSSITLSAPATQTIAGTAYAFGTWSDGGNAVHGVVVPDTAASFEVLYTPLDRPFRRLEGGDRIETALAISREFWPAGARRVVIARADLFADALAGGPLAEAAGAPILLTPGDELDSRVRTEIERLDPSDVLLLGGTAALSPAIEDAVRSVVAKVRRIDGSDRYLTAAAVDDFINSDRDSAVVATGTDFPDALVSMNLVPGRILLARRDSFDTFDPRHSYTLIGGPAALSEDIRRQTGGDRLAGSDRYGTAAAVLGHAIASRGPGPLFLATGAKAPDAMAAGAAVGLTGGYILVVDPVRGPNEIQSVLLRTHADHFTDLYVLGGPAAMPQPIVNAVAELVAENGD